VEFVVVVFGQKRIPADDENGKARADSAFFE